jgi:hypothetical protein
LRLHSITQRSHWAIMKRYDSRMASASWSNPDGPLFRFSEVATLHPKHAWHFGCLLRVTWAAGSAEEAARRSQAHGVRGEEILQPRRGELATNAWTDTTISTGMVHTVESLTGGTFG